MSTDTIDTKALREQLDELETKVSEHTVYSLYKRVRWLAMNAATRADRLRRALIETGRAGGCGLADEVSDDFLMLCAEEVRLQRKADADRLAALEAELAQMIARGNALKEAMLSYQDAALVERERAVELEEENGRLRKTLDRVFTRRIQVAPLEAGTEPSLREMILHYYRSNGIAQESAGRFTEQLIGALAANGGAE